MTNDAQPTAKREKPRFAPGKFGLCVYLSDLVRWLMEKHEDVRTRMVKEKLCPVLLAERPQLYLVQKSGEATPLPDGLTWFSSGSGNREVLPSKRARVIGRENRQYTPTIGQGLDGAVQWLLTYWGYSGNSDAVMDNKGATLAAYLVISEADARRCWGWRGADEAQPAVDAVAKAEAATPAVDTGAEPTEAAEDAPPWLTSKGYNVAWLQGERDKFRMKGGHYMAKLIANLKTQGVDVPGKDKKKEIDRYTDGKKREKKATPWGGLATSRKVSAR